MRAECARRTNALGSMTTCPPVSATRAHRSVVAKPNGWKIPSRPPSRSQARRRTRNAHSETAIDESSAGPPGAPARSRGPGASSSVTAQPMTSAAGWDAAEAASASSQPGGTVTSSWMMASNSERVEATPTFTDPAKPMSERDVMTFAPRTSRATASRTCGSTSFSTTTTSNGSVVRCTPIEARHPRRCGADPQAVTTTETAGSDVSSKMTTSGALTSAATPFRTSRPTQPRGAPQQEMQPIPHLFLVERRGPKDTDGRARRPGGSTDDAAPRHGENVEGPVDVVLSEQAHLEDDGTQVLTLGEGALHDLRGVFVADVGIERRRNRR